MLGVVHLSIFASYGDLMEVVDGGVIALTVTIKLLAHLTYQLGPCHGRNPLIARYHGATGYLSAVVMKDDVSSGCCLFVQLWSSSHTYIAENVHDNNLCLYLFYNASGGSATPWERFFPIAVSKLFYIRDTYFLYSSLLYFTYCSLNQKPKNISFTQYAFLSCYLEHYLVLLFQYLIQELLDFSLLLPVGSISLFQN